MQFEYNLGAWFIVPLFAIELYNEIARHFLEKIDGEIKELIYFAWNLCLGIIGNYLATSGLIYSGRTIFALARTLHLLPFFALGVFYRNYLEKKNIHISGMLFFSLLFAAKLALYCIYGRVLRYIPSDLLLFNEGPVMPILVGFLGIAFWVKISGYLEPLLGKNRYVNLIADNSFSIMMNQFAGFFIVKGIYAAISGFTPCFSDFDWTAFKTDIWWYYVPWGIEQTKILYLIAGIAVPIVIQKIIDAIKERIRGAVNPPKRFT